MTITKTEINEKNLATVEFSVDASCLEAEKSKAFKKKANSFNIPGFRKGKAPRNMIEKMYGKDVFLEDAINAILEESYSEVVAAAGKPVVSRPDFDIVTRDENGIVFKAEMYVKPEVTVENYKGIELTAVLAPVTDEEVDAEIENRRRQNARELEVTDRAAEMGDTATIDYEGFVDGVAFEGGKGEGHPLKLGSGQFIPGFEEGVVGKSIGEEFDVNVTFPTEYHADELAGKEAVFKVKLNKLTVEELPELDDDFAVDVSSFNTFAEYREDVRANIEKKHANAADSEVSGKVDEALATLLVAEVPEAMIDNEVDGQVRDNDSQMRMQGFDLNTYLQYFGMSLDQYKEQMRPSATIKVRAELALEKIAELEAIEVTEETLEKEYADIAANYTVEIDYVKSVIAAEDLKHNLMIKKAHEFVKAEAKVTYIDKAPEPPVEEDNN